MPATKAAAVTAEPNFDAMAEQAADILQRYIRVNTTNPPGNEELAADFLATLLQAEGIESTKLISAPGRANLYADLPLSSTGTASAPPLSARRRKGRGVRSPLVLLNHTDVVPVEAEHWQVDPFAGVVKDGFIWGRGALDMKGMGTLELVVFLAVKRRVDAGARLKRPLRFLAVADEEAGSDYGVEWLDKHHPGLMSDAAFVINEGGYGAETYLGVERPLFGVSMSEKSPLWLRIRATGRPGHGSAPHEDNCLDRIVRAMHRIQHWDRPLTITEPVANSLRAAHAEGYLAVDPDTAAPEEIVERHRQLRTIMTNTISATGLRSGVKHNVIPASAEAMIDCRLVPGYDHDRFIAEVRSVIDDPKVEVDTVFGSESPSTSPDTELHAAIKEVCGQVMPEAAVLPRVSAGFTDSRTFRRRGVPAYGFVPMLLGAGEMGGQHGNNERISLKNLRLGVEVLYRVVERVCLA
jgi:acetylornithine deacetylase/succinyl-diaminopimelate desuccinylase-like protein